MTHLPDDKYATNSRRADGQAENAAAAPAESTTSRERRNDAKQRPKASRPEHPPATANRLSDSITARLGRGEWLTDVVCRVFAQRLAASASPTAA